MQNYSSYDKISFILEELHNNFSLTEESFLSKFNVSDSEYYFYQDKASLIYCDYFFFNIKFSYTTNDFYFERIDSKLLLEGNSFFAIKALSDQQREEIFHFTEKERNIYLDNVILEQNYDFVSLLWPFLNNTFSHFINKGIDFKHIDPLYDLILTRKNLINF